MENVSRRCGSCFLAVLVTFVTLAKGADTPPDLPGMVIEAVVSDSPAAKAGLKVGDRLLSYDGKPLPSPAALQAAQENTFGKKEVALGVQRGSETLALAAPPGKLEIEVRPVILPAALQLYQEGKVSLQAKKTEEAILKWTAASRAAQGAGDNLGGAWLYGLVGAVYADQRLWKEANTALAMAWALLKESSDAGAQALALENLGRYSENLNDFSAAVRWYEQELQVDTAAGYEWWAARAINNL